MHLTELAFCNQKCQCFWQNLIFAIKTRAGLRIIYPFLKVLNSHIRILLPEFLLKHFADLAALLALLLHILDGLISGKQR